MKVLLRDEHGVHGCSYTSELGYFTWLTYPRGCCMVDRCCLLAVAWVLAGLQTMHPSLVDQSSGKGAAPCRMARVDTRNVPRRVVRMTQPLVVDVDSASFHPCPKLHCQVQGQLSPAGFPTYLHRGLSSLGVGHPRIPVMEPSRVGPRKKLAMSLGLL